MSRRVGSRALAVASLAVAVAAGAAAVLSALGASSASLPTASAAAGAAQTVSFGSARVVVSQGSGGTCFRLGSSRSCGVHLRANTIAYVSVPGAVGGVAGSNVRAVIVRLDRKGTAWATLKQGAFYAAVPSSYRVRALVKVLRDGSRTTFSVTASR